MQLHRQPVRGNAHRLQKLLPKNFPRMHGPTRRTFVLDAHDYFSSIKNSVVIRYLHIEGIAIAPHEAHPELIVDPNAMLACSIIAQPLQSVTGRDS